MKSILIVDDELLARLGLKSLIFWEEYGYEIIGEAENGQQALTFIKQTPPDIVLCDMKMPVMDGITLIKELQKLPSPPQIIATSAYDDFHYVKQALKDGACDYLLKSELDPSVLLQTLENVSSKLTVNSLHSHTFTPGHLKLLREDFLKNLFNGKNLPDSYISDQQNLLNIQLPSEHFFCLSLKIIVSEDSTLNLSELKETIEEVLSNTLKNYGLNQFLVSCPNQVLILIQPHKELNTLPNKEFLAACAESLNHMIALLFNCTCYIGASRICHSLPELPSAHQQALDAMEKAIFTKTVLVQYTTHFNDTRIEFTRTLEMELKSIEQSLSSLDSNNLKKSFEQLIHKIHLLDATDQKYLRGICNTLTFITNRQIALRSIDVSHVWSFDSSPYETIGSFENRWQYCKWIQQLSSSLLQAINPENENQRIILEAKKYMRAHYASNLSLDFMADYLSLSPNYFSKIFKKYTNTGFIDYLTELRMQKAEELLKSGKYKIYEVSAMVGYENSTYFSRIFKKRYGHSPYQSKTDLTS